MTVEAVLFIVIAVATGGHMIQHPLTAETKTCIEDVKRDFPYGKAPTEDLEAFLEACDESVQLSSRDQ